MANDRMVLRGNEVIIVARDGLTNEQSAALCGAFGMITVVSGVSSLDVFRGLTLVRQQTER